MAHFKENGDAWEVGQTEEDLNDNGRKGGGRRLLEGGAKKEKSASRTTSD